MYHSDLYQLRMWSKSRLWERKCVHGASFIPRELEQGHPNFLFLFFIIHFRAPWGTEPYVALHFVYLCVCCCASSNNNSLPFPLYNLPALSKSGFALRQVLRTLRRYSRRGDLELGLR